MLFADYARAPDKIEVAGDGQGMLADFDPNTNEENHAQASRFFFQETKMAESEPRTVWKGWWLHGMAEASGKGF